MLALKPAVSICIRKCCVRMRRSSPPSTALSRKGTTRACHFQRMTSKYSGYTELECTQDNCDTTLMKKNAGCIWGSCGYLPTKYARLDSRTRPSMPSLSSSPKTARSRSRNPRPSIMCMVRRCQIRLCEGYLSDCSCTCIQPQEATRWICIHRSFSRCALRKGMFRIKTKSSGALPASSAYHEDCSGTCCKHRSIAEPMSSSADSKSLPRGAAEI